MGLGLGKDRGKGRGRDRDKVRVGAEIPTYPVEVDPTLTLLVLHP